MLEVSTTYLQLQTLSLFHPLHEGCYQPLATGSVRFSERAFCTSTYHNGVKICSQRINRTELQFCIPKAASVHSTRSDWAPTVLVSPQPIKSWRWRASDQSACCVTGSTWCRSVQFMCCEQAVALRRPITRHCCDLCVLATTPVIVCQPVVDHTHSISMLSIVIASTACISLTPSSSWPTAAAAIIWLVA